MRNITNPQQTRLFDAFDHVLTDRTRQHLLESWPGVFRHVILELLPADVISEHFDPTMGRPTKELYSMAGLLLIQEFMNWTKDEAVNAYRFHTDIHYALNLEPVAHDISKRSFERYIKLFEEDDLAKTVMDKITATLVEQLDLKIDKQRLDSTHIYSDMASFGRTHLMAVAVKRFLTQVIRHNKQDYDLLDEAFRQRYVTGIDRLFADTKKDKEARKLLRQQVAKDMHYIIGRFASMGDYNGKTTYKNLEQIFYEQCEVHEQAVVVKKKTGGNVMQNPSDPDATYDGHKGQGYQVQLVETCHDDNAQQIIISATPQTAAESDGDAVEIVLDDLESNDLLPDEMLVDAGYTGDDNVQLAEEKDVELVGPSPSGSRKNNTEKYSEFEQLNIDDFDVDEATEEVICCPAGHKPQSSTHNSKTGQTKTVMPSSACNQCEYTGQCPVKKIKYKYRLDHSGLHRRVASRRREQDTDVFRERYRKRSGIEGTNSGVKRRTGLGHLRVRGKDAVFRAIYLKIAGWNIFRATCCAKMRELVLKRACAAIFKPVFTLFAHQSTIQQAGMAVIMRLLPNYRQTKKITTSSNAA